MILNFVPVSYILKKGKIHHELEFTKKSKRATCVIVMQLVEFDNTKFCSSNYCTNIYKLSLK